MSRYPRATWAPLPEHGHEGVNDPKLFVTHVIVGSLAGARAWFARPDVKSESHFGLGEGHEPDPVQQWLDTDEEADTNWDANGRSVTVETAGLPNEPFTPFQIRELIDLAVWAGRVHGIPPQLADGPYGEGFGWHAMYPEWNRSAHTCPGPKRIAQLRDHIYPEVFRRLKDPEVPRTMYAQAVVYVPGSLWDEALAVCAGAFYRAATVAAVDGQLISDDTGQPCKVGFAWLVGKAQDKATVDRRLFPDGVNLIAGDDRYATARDLAETMRAHPAESIQRRGKPW